jgi:hypothetical protein
MQQQIYQTRDRAVTKTIHQGPAESTKPPNTIWKKNPAIAITTLILNERNEQRQFQNGAIARQRYVIHLHQHRQIAQLASPKSG